MDWLLESGAVIGLFLIRLAVPVALTLAVGYSLRRLDVRWQAQAWTKWEASQPQERILEQAKALLPAQPCWSLKGCDESRRADCAAAKQPALPCWMARLRSQGRLPVDCVDCGLFSLRQIAQSLAG